MKTTQEALSTLKKDLGDIFAKVKVKDHSLIVYLHKGPEHDIAKLNIVKYRALLNYRKNF